MPIHAEKDILTDRIMYVSVYGYIGQMAIKECFVSVKSVHLSEEGKAKELSNEEMDYLKQQFGSAVKFKHVTTYHDEVWL